MRFVRLDPGLWEMAICNLSRRRTPHLDATSYPGSQSSLLPRLSGIGWSRDPSYFGGFAQLFLGERVVTEMLCFVLLF
jgi:hypothetical protein